VGGAVRSKSIGVGSRPGGVERVVSVRTGILSVLLATIAWSFGGVIAKSIDAPGLVVTVWRNWCAAALWFALGAATRRLPSWRDIRRATLAGVLFGANLALFFSSLRYIDLVSALIVIALTPVALMPVARITLGERFSPVRVGCGVLAVLGVAVYTWVTPRSTAGQGSNPALGYALVTGAMLLWVIYLVVSKRVRATMDTTPFLASISLVGAVVMTPVALILGQSLRSIHGSDWGLIVLLAVGPGMIAHGLVAWAQRHVDATVSSVLMQAETVGAAVLAWIFLGERLTLAQCVALGGVLIALVLLALHEDRLGAARELAALG
jgi:drug/metabolite transporter (DMT)-like permease